MGVAGNDESLEDVLRDLSPELQREVEDFARFLRERHAPRKKGKLKLDWAGGLRDYKDQYTSLELQKKSLEWWGD
jgi:hypothetical protein